MAASSPAERKVLDLLLNSGFISEEQLEKSVHRDGKTLQALLDLGLVSEPTLLTVVGLELKIQGLQGEGIEQFIDRVYKMKRQNRSTSPGRNPAGSARAK